MSFSPNQYLKADAVEHLRCQQHAARTFADEQFRLLPKNKFLYHVSFNINWPALNIKNINVQTILTLKDEINLLVKSTDLPTYSVSHDILNQYNRKRVVQYQHKYNDINMSFHDDNMGLINQLWQTYYKYHYADPTVSNTRGAYNKTAMKSSSFITAPYGFNGKIAPFFNYITIYQMARHEYVSYKLINPMITSWSGNKLAYSDGGSHHFDLKLAYEAVYYDVGYVNSGDMEGFGSVHYDFVPSPLTSSWPQNISPSPSFANTTFGGSSSVATPDVVKTATTPAGTSNFSTQQQSYASPGVAGVSIPTAASANSTTVAKQVSLGTTGTTTGSTSTGITPDYLANY
jgi:hypothetical protein